MGVCSRLAPNYLPICTEKYFFVPLPTLKSVLMLTTLSQRVADRC